MSSIYFVKELWKYRDVQKVIDDFSVVKEICEVGGFQGDSLRIVGVFYTTSDDQVFCCPKYFSDSLINSANKGNEKAINGIKEHMILIVKVLDRLRSEGKNIEEVSYDFSCFDMNRERKRISRYNLATSIVEDYLENGVYYSSEKEIKKNGKGKIRWGMTMRKVEPIISNGNVIYSNLLKQTDYKNYDKELTELHKNVICQCIEYLQQLGEKETVEKPAIIHRLEKTMMNKYVAYIKQCMLTSYTNREILLFKALISWCDESPYYRGMGCTTCFLNVWEWVNDSVWGTLELKKEDVKSSAPSFYFGNDVYKGSGDAQPDTLAYVNDEEKQYMVIFDSKYYVPKTKIQHEKNNMIIGLPSNHDIVKQVAYLKEIKKVCGNQISYSNIFLLPECEQYEQILEGKNFQKLLYKLIGLCSQGSFEELCKKLDIAPITDKNMKEYVGVALVSPMKLYEQYLYLGKVGKQEIIDVAELYETLISEV